jgi:hypothetical protein
MPSRGSAAAVSLDPGRHGARYQWAFAVENPAPDLKAPRNQPRPISSPD